MKTPVTCMIFMFCATNFVIAHPQGSSEEEDDPGKYESPPDEDSSSGYEETSQKNGQSGSGGIMATFNSWHKKAFDTVGELYEKGAQFRQMLGLESKRDFHQKAYDTAGTLHGMAAGIRVKLEDQRQKLIDLWKQIDLKGKTAEEKIAMAIDVILEKGVQHVPPISNSRAFEDVSKTSYICGAKGFMGNYQTIKKVDTKVNRNEGGFYAVVDVKFDELLFNYTIFYMKALRVERKGFLVINFGDNVIRVALQFVKPSQIITNLVKTACIVTVMSVEVPKLDFKSSSLSGPKDNAGRKFLSGRLKSHFKDHIDELRSEFLQQTLVEIQKSLTTSNAWICKDESIGVRMKALGGTTDDFAITDTFRTNCGDDINFLPED